MTRITWSESLGWFFGTTILGAVVGGAIAPFSEYIGSIPFSQLRGLVLGSLLGSLGAFVVISTKASTPIRKTCRMTGVVFISQDHGDAWYYQDLKGGNHGPFNRSMMEALVKAGARVVANTYPEVSDVPPAQPKTRITQPKILKLNTMRFNETTHVIARAG